MLATRLGFLALIGGLALSVGCAAPTPGQQRMSQLCEQMQAVSSVIERGRGDVQDALDAYGWVVSNADDDLFDNFTNLRRATDRLAARQHDIGLRAEAMEASTTAYLAGWQADLERISDSDLRARSEKRMNLVKQRLEQVRADVTATQKAFDPMLGTLRDHTVYLANDLTMEAASSLSKDSTKLNEQAAKLDAALEKGAQAARDCARTLSVQPQT